MILSVSCDVAWAMLRFHSRHRGLLPIPDRRAHGAAQLGSADGVIATAVVGVLHAAHVKDAVDLDARRW
jgi:hypothetical protein